MMLQQTAMVIGCNWDIGHWCNPLYFQSPTKPPLIPHYHSICSGMSTKTWPRTRADAIQCIVSKLLGLACSVIRTTLSFWHACARVRVCLVCKGMTLLGKPHFWVFLCQVCTIWKMLFGPNMCGTCVGMAWQWVLRSYSSLGTLCSCYRLTKEAEKHSLCYSQTLILSSFEHVPA